MKLRYRADVTCDHRPGPDLKCAASATFEKAIGYPPGPLDREAFRNEARAHFEELGWLLDHGEADENFCPDHN